MSALIEEFANTLSLGVIAGQRKMTHRDPETPERIEQRPVAYGSSPYFANKMAQVEDVSPLVTSDNCILNHFILVCKILFKCD